MAIHAFFSLQSLVDLAGGYAGLAAVVGLAVLSVLYFAQAREVKRLREWAGRSPERAQELEARVIEQAHQASRVARPPIVGSLPTTPVTPVARMSDPGVVAVTAPATVAGQDEARLKEVDAEELEPVQPDFEVEGGSASDAVLQGREEYYYQGELTAERRGDYVADAEEALPYSHGEHGGGELDAYETLVPFADDQQLELSTAAVDAPAAAATPLHATQLYQVTGAPPTIPPPSRRRQSYDGRRKRKSLALIVIGLVVVAVAVVLAVGKVTGSGSTELSSTAEPTGAKRVGSVHRVRSLKPVVRRDVTVAVLNGTTVNGLAAQVADQLATGGFSQGTVENAPSQQQLDTEVKYLPGEKQAALEVAKVISVARVEPMDPDTKAIAGSTADVVVTVGADRTE